jgi:hypothetical protein
LVVVGWALWWPTLFRPVGRLDELVGWTTAPSGEELHAMLRAPWLWVYGGTPSWLGLWLDLVVVVVVVVGATRLGRTGWILLATFVTWPLVSIAFSSHQPVLLDRVLIPSSVAVYPLIAAGLWSLGRWMGMVGTGGLLLLAIPGLISFSTDFELSEFERAAEIVAAESTDDTAVVYVANFSQFAFDHYAQLDGTEVGVPSDFLDDPLGSQIVELDDRARVVSLAADVSDIWLVYTREESLDPDRLVDKWLRESMTPIKCIDLRGIELIQYSRDGEADPTCP